MDNPRCPETGAVMERGVRPMTLTYKGKNITFDMPGWYCEASDEGIHTGDDMKVSDRALNRLKAQIEGLLPPEEIRRIRKRLQLTQVIAGELIGGGPRAFQKYEMGDLLPSRAISSALLLLDRDPNGLNALKSQDRGYQGRTNIQIVGQDARPTPALSIVNEESKRSNKMATNPPKGDGHRVGAIKGRSQSTNPKTGLSTKRDTTTGKFMDVKTSGGKFKGVRKEK